jgi:hypothetical protein
LFVAHDRVGFTDGSPPGRSQTLPELRSTIELAAIARRTLRSAKPQPAGPHVELHRIVFARRKTAWATSMSEPSADARDDQR